MKNRAGMKNAPPGSALPSCSASTLPFLLAAALVILAASQTGCLLHSAEIARTHRAFEAAYPAAQFEREAVFDLGPLTLSMAGGLMRRWARDDFEQFGPYLRDLRRVEVGVYNVENLSSPGAVDPLRLPVLRDGGWDVAVRVREADEHVWVLYRTRRREVRDLYVLTLGSDELVVARLHGRLDRIAARALEMLPNGNPP